MYSFSYLEPVCCSMSSSNCCLLTYIQVSQGAGQVVWYSHLFQNFSQFIVIHTGKGFGIVNKAEIDIFLELSCFLPADVGNLFSGSSAFCKSSLNTWDWSPLRWTDWTSLRSKGLSRVFSTTTVPKHQFFGAQLSSQPNSHIHTWILGKNHSLD